MEILLFLVGFAYLLYRINNLEGLITRSSLRELPAKPNPPLTQYAEVPAPPPPPSSPTYSSHVDKDLEFKLGSRAFTAVGLVAITFGVAFFLRYAFEKELIT